MNCYSFDFSTDEDATYFVNSANQIAIDYGYVMLADLNDLRGEDSNYTDNFIRWSPGSIANKVYIYYDRSIKRYVVHFPEPDELTSKQLSDALKTAINSVYGLTSASFNNPFHSMKNKPIDSTKSAKSYVVRKETVKSSEPISITILVDALKDPKTVAREVFDIAKQIKDRPVFITIS